MFDGRNITASLQIISKEFPIFEVIYFLLFYVTGLTIRSTYIYVAFSSYIIVA